MCEICVANQRFDANVEGVLIGSRSDFPFWAENHYRHALLRNRRANIILRNPAHPTKHLPKSIFPRSEKTGISRIALFWLGKCHPEQKTQSQVDRLFPKIQLRGILACRGRLFVELTFQFSGVFTFCGKPAARAPSRGEKSIHRGDRFPRNQNSQFWWKGTCSTRVFTRNGDRSSYVINTPGPLPLRKSYVINTSRPPTRGVPML